MVRKLLIIFLGSCLMALTACGNQAVSEPIQLQNQDGQEVTLPAEKPVVLFFMTTYT